MKTLLHCQKVLILYIVFFGVVARIKGRIKIGPDLQQKGHLQRITSTDLVQMTRRLNVESNNRLNLQILFYLEYEGIVSDTAMQVSSKVNWLAVFYNDNKNNGSTTRLLSSVLSMAVNPTFLMVLSSAENIVAMFTLIRQKRLESHLVQWILVLEGEEDSSVVTKGLEGLVHEGTNVTLLTKVTEREFVISPSTLDEDYEIRFQKKGTWKTNTTDEENIHLFIPSVNEDIYEDMKGRMLTIGSYNTWPFFGIGVQYEDGSFEAKSGIEVMILKCLSQTLNFTYRVVTPKSIGPGFLQPDGTVTGIIGLAARREVHASASLLAMNEIRATVIDYTISYYTGSLGLYSRAPELKSRALAIMSSFTSEVWLSIMLCVLAMGPLWFAMSRVPTDHDGRGHTQESLQVFSFNVFRVIVLQGNDIPAKRTSQKILYFAWYIFSVIFLASFSGMLTAVLAIPSYEKTINSLADLPEAVSDGYTLTVQRDSTNEQLFKQATDGIYKEVWGLFNHKDRSKSFIVTFSEGVEKVLKHKNVLIAPAGVAEVIAAQLGRKKFHFGKEEFYPQQVAFACPQGAPYIKNFNKVFRRLNEAGLPEKWRKDEIFKIPQEPEGGDSKSMTSAMTLEHLQAAFYIAFIGFTIAFIALIGERIITNSYGSSSTKQTSNY